MTEFTDLPLQKLLNRRNPITRIENLERNRALPSARAGQLGQIGQSTGNLIVDGGIVVPNRIDGVPDVTINDYGVNFRNQEGAINFADVTTGNIDLVQIAIDSGDALVFANAVGGKSIRMDLDDPSHNVINLDFNYAGINIPSGTHYFVQGEPLGYSLMASSLNNTPADATTYYFGAHPGSALTTTADRRKLFIPCSGTVTQVSLFITFVAGSNEQSTMSFSLNGSTDTAITTTLDLSASPVEINNISLSIPVFAGDYFEIKWLTPTWATNPTAVSVTAQVWIEF